MNREERDTRRKGRRDEKKIEIDRKVPWNKEP